MSVTLVGIRFGVFASATMPLRLIRVGKSSMLVLTSSLDRTEG